MEDTENVQRAIVGSKKCPRCGRKFARLKSSSRPSQRSCECGARWTIYFEPVEPEFAACLGMPADRMIVTPYVDGRRRGANPGKHQLAFEVEPTTPKRRRRASVVRHDPVNC